MWWLCNHGNIVVTTIMSEYMRSFVFWPVTGFSLENDPEAVISLYSSFNFFRVWRSFDQLSETIHVHKPTHVSAVIFYLFKINLCIHRWILKIEPICRCHRCNTFLCHGSTCCRQLTRYSKRKIMRSHYVKKVNFSPLNNKFCRDCNFEWFFSKFETLEKKL